MLNLPAEEQKQFDAALSDVARTEAGRVFLSFLEGDLSKLDERNRVRGKENETSAAYYLALLMRRAKDAGFESKKSYVYIRTYERPNSVFLRILSAIAGTER